MIDLLTAAILGAIESIVNFFSNPYLTIADLVFHADTYITKTLSVSELKVFSKYILNIGYSLIMIKALIRGFNQYDLMQEGDADASPLALFGRFIKAIVIAVSFPQLYEWGTEIGMDIIDRGLDSLAGVQTATLSEIVYASLAGGGFFVTVLTFAFLIMYVLLYFQFIRRGLEMLVLKIGVSWACIGILDSDEEVFRTYIKKFFQSFITVFVQLILLKLAMALVFQGQNIWGVAAMSLALSTPKFLQEFMIVSSGDGGTLNKAYYAGSMAKGLLKVVKG